MTIETAVLARPLLASSGRARLIDDPVMWAKNTNIAPTALANKSEMSWLEAKNNSNDFEFTQTYAKAKANMNGT